jgi:magnesium transporter
MARFINFLKEQVGLAPDTIQFIGENKLEEVRLSLMDYSDAEVNEKLISSIDEVVPFQKSTTKTWFNVDGLHDGKIMKEISDKLNIDPRLISDTSNTSMRPRMYEYNDHIFISCKMFQWDDEKKEAVDENLVIILKDNILVTFQEKKGDVFEPVRNRIRAQKPVMVGSDLSYLILALLDVIFDNYGVIISHMGEDIENIENEIINDISPKVLKKINDYKSEIIYLKKAIKPCREILNSFKDSEFTIFDKNGLKYLKDLQLNLDDTQETLESYRNLLSDQLNIYHTTMSTKLNDIMKFLTVFSVIFIPLTFIAGIYGTNFENVPELKYKYSYFIMLGAMAVVALIMIFYFKRKKWI